MKKKILCMIVMLCLVITLFPAAALAEMAPTPDNRITGVISVNGKIIDCKYTVLTAPENGNPGTVAIAGYFNDVSGDYFSAINMSTEGDAVIPSSITVNAKTYSVTKIGQNAFYGCGKITNITIPESVTFIDGYAFLYCPKLTSITIPKSVTNISYKSFFYCSNLATITFKGLTAPTLDTGVFKYLLEDFKIIIPDGATGYTDGYWSEWQNHILRKLDFTDQADYDISASTVGTAISPIDISKGVSGGTAPYTFTASGLPAGITISNTGIISGTPTTACNAGTATITVTDNGTPTSTASITIQYGAVTAKEVAHTHNYNETIWKTNADSHWHECIVPGCTALQKDMASHTPGEWIIDKAATATVTGKKHTECTICKDVTAEETIPSTHNHNYNETVWKTDAASHWHECIVPGCTALKKDLASHTSGDWVIDKAATTAETGKKHTECTVCKAVTAEEVIPTIPKTVRSFTAGIYKYKVTSAEGAKTATVELAGLAQGKSTSKVTVKKTVTYKKKTYKITGISNKAFYKNKGIKEVDIDNNVIKIGNHAFYQCINLKKVAIGTGLKTIGEHVFCRDKKLTSFIIESKKLTKVGKHNLYQCKNLKIKVPSSKVKAYTKLFQNQGQKSNVKVTK